MKNARSNSSFLISDNARDYLGIGGRIVAVVVRGQFAVEEHVAAHAEHAVLRAPAVVECEPAVLAGLTRAVPALSFEYLPRALDQVRACITRLSALGTYRYNWSPGETFSLAAASWLSGKELLGELGTPRARQRSGDVYARLSPSASPGV